VCLGVPGKVLTVQANAQGLAMGTVSFGGVQKEVCLAYVPEARAGDYVIVHVGFAISIVSEREAEETFEILRRMGELADLEEAPPGDVPAKAGGDPEDPPPRPVPGSEA